MKDAGVTVERVTDPDDVKILEDHIKEHNGYARAFTEKIYSGQLVVHNPASRAEIWFNGTIYPMYLAGMRSASGNMMMLWVMNIAKENCTTCRTLNGQIHRLRDYLKAGWFPKSRKLECGGHHCGCQFVPAFGARSRGRFPKAT
jgi:hypothetical protein